MVKNYKDIYAMLTSTGDIVNLAIFGCGQAVTL